jgi:O-antigen/teichoic acid export membrane protein
MDRWFVKILLGTVAFAQYAFAVSMENFLNAAVTPVSVTLYSYFCNHDETQNIKKIRDLVMAFSTVIAASAFPVKFILEIYLHKYLESADVIFILFAAQMFYIIIKSVYVNLYKARKMQKKYFVKLCFILVIAFLFNIVCYQIYSVKESFAAGTLLSAIVWFFLSQSDFKKLEYSFKHYVFIFAEIFVYLLCGMYLESMIGCCVYVVFTIIMVKLCIPDAYDFGRNMAVKTWSRVRGGNK